MNDIIAMGLILASVAVASVLAGIEEYFSL